MCKNLKIFQNGIAEFRSQTFFEGHFFNGWVKTLLLFTSLKVDPFHKLMETALEDWSKLTVYRS